MNEIPLDKPIKSAYEIAMEKIERGDFEPTEEEKKTERTEEPLAIDNIIIVGEDHPHPEETRRRIESIRPKIVCLEEPQDFQKYFNIQFKGEELDAALSEMIKDGLKEFTQQFTAIFSPLAKYFSQIGVEEVYFVGLPSYYEQISPFFLEGNDAVVDDKVREAFMSARTLEVKNKSSDKIVLRTGMVHEIPCHIMISRAYELGTNLQEEKESIYNMFKQLLDAFSEEPNLTSSHSRGAYNHASKEFLHHRREMWEGLQRGEDISEYEAKNNQLCATLSVLSYDSDIMLMNQLFPWF